MSATELSSERFLLVPGLEIEDLNVLLLGINHIAEYSSPLELAEQCREQGALIVFSHPVKCPAGPSAGIAPMLEGLEVWNTRYDGKIVPRAGNLKLFQEWKERKKNMIGLCGLDFHSTSDYTDVWMKVALKELSQEGLLRAMRTGDLQICKNGKRLPIQQPSASFALKSIVYRVVYDAAYAAFRTLRSVGINPPRQFKQLARKIF